MFMSSFMTLYLAQDLDFESCCFVLTAPITMPLAGLAWCCWKVYGLFKGYAIMKQVARLESQLPFTDNMLKDNNILLGWQVGNTIYIALDDCSPHGIVNQIEKHYDNKKSYVFLLVDALKIDTLSIHAVMRSVHEKNSLSVYRLAAPDSTNLLNL